MDNGGVIFGIRAVIEAIGAGREIDKLLIRKDLQGDLSKELFNVIKGRGIPVQKVPAERLNRITRKNHQGVIAFTTEITYQHIEDIVPTLFEDGINPFVILLDGITDVRNFGAIARTAECAGADAIIIPKHNSVSANADAVKTSAGALHTIPVCREARIDSTLRYLRDSGFHIVGATEKGDTPYTHGDFSGPVCLVMGAEDNGIPSEHLSLCDEWVRIPISGKIESLNVSVAAGILIYEILRQRNDNA
ncbi:MAG: 23S rRNA (guanosine(2251)-2'-O)-methyltransferase RlmB [Bacteroidaceae bacterium]|nr:23S rRNA (guanosine(2251)-2'-O)-methyltransferase RlmB [Bacteroidaceae bacterium]